MVAAIAIPTAVDPGGYVTPKVLTFERAARRLWRYPPPRELSIGRYCGSREPPAEKGFQYMQTPRMRIPVFVSSPSPDNLSPSQEASAVIIHRLVRRYKLEWRALGRSDYPNDLPLTEVLRMVRHCSGGIILGFEQFRAPTGEFRAGSPNASTETDPSFPTPWNQLEAGILFSAGLPMMIFKEPDVRGGIFDIGNTEVFVHQIPTSRTPKQALDDLDSVFQNWVARVRTHYYGH